MYVLEWLWGFLLIQDNVRHGVPTIPQKYFVSNFPLFIINFAQLTNFMKTLSMQQQCDQIRNGCIYAQLESLLHGQILIFDFTSLKQKQRTQILHLSAVFLNYITVLHCLDILCDFLGYWTICQPDRYFLIEWKYKIGYLISLRYNYKR